MSTGQLLAAQRAVVDAMAQLRALEEAASGQELIDNLKFHRLLRRQSEHDVLRVIARLDRDGEFVRLNVYPAAAVADVLRCRRGVAARLVALAHSVFPTTSLDGQSLPPMLPATAAAWGDWVIDQAHAEVIEKVLGGAAAKRLPPEVWSAAEAQLARWARSYGVDELRRWGESLVSQLDSDGAEPDTDDDAQVNELRMSRCGT
jgi:hypothetical protein